MLSLDPMSKNPREAAFLALCSHTFIDDALDQWRQTTHPTDTDARLAKQIATGSVQMAAALDHLAAQLTARGSLKIKTKERFLLRTALYQAHFMERIPLYAIVNETVQIARKHCHRSFVPFLNALLRAYDTKKPMLSQGHDAASLALRYSYPHDFVDLLLTHYGSETTVDILTYGNKPAPVMARVRSETSIPVNSQVEVKAPFTVIALDPSHPLSDLTCSPNYYIQNATQAYLIGELSKMTPTPQTILDLCAAPGGKLLAAADLYPTAKLTANDVSEKRLTTLKANIDKYGIAAHLTCYPGQEYPVICQYDLVIIDAPCSNSGVLNKRAEARWRLNAPALQQLQELQQKLLRRAVELLAPGGTIWYLTCSILPEENEQLIAFARHSLSLDSAYMKTILPQHSGWDGGFGCQLKRLPICQAALPTSDAAHQPIKRPLKGTKKAGS